MPRGHRRSDIEIFQSQIADAQKRRDKNMEAVAKEKKEITRLEKEINRKIADEIAAACRTKGMPLETVLKWILAQPDEPAQAELAKSDDGVAVPKGRGGRKPAVKKPAAKKPAARTKKRAPKAASKGETVTEPVPVEASTEA